MIIANPPYDRRYHEGTKRHEEHELLLYKIFFVIFVVLRAFVMTLD